jgi:flagellar protein FlaG
MDVILKTPELKMPATVVKGSRAAVADGTAKPQPLLKQEPAKANPRPAVKVSPEEYNLLADELNKFMDGLDVNIRFAIHEKTQQMMVRVLDAKDERVLREYPAHELLDTLAAIREYVGVLLDKKA